MQIHWARSFPRLGEPLRAEVESRLCALALGYRDLTDARVVAERVDSNASSVRVQIRGLVRGHPVASSAARPELERALRAALDDFEREIHELRERRRTLRRQSWVSLERATHATEGEARGRAI